MKVVFHMASGRMVTQSQGKQVLQSLLSFGEDPHKTDVRGNNVLHQAVILGVEAAVPILLRNGADISAQNAAGKTAFELAKLKYTRSRNEDITAVFTARRLKTIVHLLESESCSRQKMRPDRMRKGEKV
jgi:Ankyrin repeats (many copies)